MDVCLNSIWNLSILNFNIDWYLWIDLSRCSIKFGKKVISDDDLIVWDFHLYFYLKGKENFSRIRRIWFNIMFYFYFLLLLLLLYFFFFRSYDKGLLNFPYIYVFPGRKFINNWYDTDSLNFQFRFLVNLESLSKKLFLVISYN